MKKKTPQWTGGLSPEEKPTLLNSMASWLRIFRILHWILFLYALYGGVRLIVFPDGNSLMRLFAAPSCIVGGVVIFCVRFALLDVYTFMKQYEEEKEREKQKEKDPEKKTES